MLKLNEKESTFILICKGWTPKGYRNNNEIEYNIHSDEYILKEHDKLVYYYTKLYKIPYNIVTLEDINNELLEVFDKVYPNSHSILSNLMNRDNVSIYHIDRLSTRQQMFIQLYYMLIVLSVKKDDKDIIEFDYSGVIKENR